MMTRDEAEDFIERIGDEGTYSLMDSTTQSLAF